MNRVDWFALAIEAGRHVEMPTEDEALMNDMALREMAARVFELAEGRAAWNPAQNEMRTHALQQNGSPPFRLNRHRSHVELGGDADTFMREPIQ